MDYKIEELRIVSKKTQSVRIIKLFYLSKQGIAFHKIKKSEYNIQKNILYYGHSK